MEEWAGEGGAAEKGISKMLYTFRVWLRADGACTFHLARISAL